MEKYTRTDEVSHILLRPDAYVGSKTLKPSLEYLLYEDLKLERKQIQKSPALERTFIEIISNAVDNSLRHGTTKNIKIMVTKDECSIWNDGNVIPIVKNETEDMYNHTLIFGFLRSSSNYDDSKKRFVSGRNGFGAKLTNVFSTEFYIEGVDPNERKKLTQTWTNNMKVTSGPVVTNCSLKNGYTLVRWKLDFSQFSIPEYSDDIINLFRSHALDASLNTNVNVYFNSLKLPSTLQKYAGIVLSKELTGASFIKLDSHIGNIKTQILIFQGDGEFEQISFVNGIRTKNGGKHVDAWAEAICRPIMKKLEVSRSSQSVSFRDVKKYLKFIVIATVPNPEFESQEKTCLEAPSFTIPNLEDIYVSKILLKWGIKKLLKEQYENKEKIKISKVIATKKGKVIPGYDKANFSGGSRSKDCILIICEGLSAKTFAVEGLTYGLCDKKGRDWIGIYPLRGKILNTRKANVQKMSDNEIITNLVTIIGLDITKPDKLDNLHYGKICLITDADTDGIHIKALLLNWAHNDFPKLLDKIVCMNTPIVRVGKTYYFDERTEIKAKGERKYFKGLGTTERKDIGIIFGKKMTKYLVTDDTTKSLEMAFGKLGSTERKLWVGRYDPLLKRTDTIDYINSQWCEQKVEDFIENDLVQYAHDDCVRSIPSVFDGLKESQRKILYAAKKEKMYSELKITQFSGYVSKDTEYHHGEQNLFSTIIKMAQNFVGSNNLPFFASEAMFGTRLSGGQDASQARYLHTNLLKTTELMFPSVDDKLLKIQTEGKLEIEPLYFVPILPTILINGCKGIGTGWCCDIPCFSVSDVADNVKRWIDKEDLKPMIPYYNGFKGTIKDIGSGKFEVKGIWQRISETKIKITELPIGYWNDKFKEWCGNQEDIKDLKDYSTYKDVDMVIITSKTFPIEKIDKELTCILNTNNTVVFDEKNVIKSISINNIFNLWGQERYRIYIERKTKEVADMTAKIEELNEKYTFIGLVKDGIIDLFGDEKTIINTMNENGIIKHVETVRNIPTKHFTKEMRLKLKNLIDETSASLKELSETTIRDMWLRDIDKFYEAFEKTIKL